MGKKKLYLIVDTETCTLPFIKGMDLTEKQRQKVSIAKPLIYDIGWVIMDSKGNYIKKQNYLIQETFFVPQVFNTAYYKAKRPFYIDLYNKGELSSVEWYTALKELLRDISRCDLVCASNATFDIKKAIPFTNKYIWHLHHNDFEEWLNKQYIKCQTLLYSSEGEQPKNPDYLNINCNIWNVPFVMCDLWGLACERLLNNNRYKDFCIKNKLYTNSVQYFSTNVENCYKYLFKNIDFTEQHTALSDAIVESQILLKILKQKKKKIEGYCKPFPFRDLGTTTEYVINHKPKAAEELAELMLQYLNNCNTASTNYIAKIEAQINALFECAEMYNECAKDFC